MDTAGSQWGYGYRILVYPKLKMYDVINEDVAAQYRIWDEQKIRMLHLIATCCHHTA